MPYGLVSLRSLVLPGALILAAGCAAEAPSTPTSSPHASEALAEYRVFFNRTDEYLEFDLVGTDDNGNELKFGGRLIVDLHLAELRSRWANCPAPPKVERKTLTFTPSDFVQVAIPYRGAVEDHLAARLFLEAPPAQQPPDDCHGSVQGGELLMTKVWLMAGPFGGDDPPLTFED